MPFPASIVVPLLRQRDEWLLRAVDSALAQSVPSEVLVITSPHTPVSNLEVLERVRERAEGRLIVAPRTGSGFPNAVNTGLALAAGPRVGLLLSDDWLEPDAIAECLAIDADIVSTGAMRYTAAGEPMPHLRRALSRAAYANRRTLEEKASYLTHFFLFRRTRLAEVGGLDESLGDAPGIDDYDLIWTLLEHGASVGLTTRPLYNFTVHAGERLTMRSADAQLATLERIFDKHGFTGPVRERRLFEHARWFGRPEDVALAEIRARDEAG
jgi:glycosyltransferase involved in cell wall biosynthesis